MANWLWEASIGLLTDTHTPSFAAKYQLASIWITFAETGHAATRITLSQ